jgi:hypothetical protein
MVRTNPICRPGYATAVRAGAAIDPATLPPVIYFGGSSDQLVTFVKALRSSDCLSPNGSVYQVLTGPDAANVPNDDDYKNALGPDGPVTVTYTGRVHPDQLGPSPPQEFTNLLNTFKGQLPSASLDDEQGIMGHDAVWTAARVARTAWAPGPDALGTMRAIRQALGQVQEDLAVEGASGRIEFDNCGNRTGAAVPIVQLQFVGGSVRHVLKRVEHPTRVAGCTS